MADVKPAETASAAPAPAPAKTPIHATATSASAPPEPAPDPRDLAIRSAVADLERLIADAAGRGDQAAVEPMRVIALRLDAAIPKA
jgi:hypothetical protein